MSDKNNERRDHIKSVVEELLGEPVRSIETPGGESRASCRVILENRTVIATSRPNFRRTHLEAAVLRALSPRCSHVPEFLGLSDNVLIQSDVGGQRLSQKIRGCDIAGCADLAVRSVSAILSIQHEAQDALRDVPVPPLGCTAEWVKEHVASCEVLSGFGVSFSVDSDEIARQLTVEPRQFLKWDCRSGNAAVSSGGDVRWFDFEYCGMRHGAEDLAWLIADESWPVDAPTMFGIVETLLPAFDVADTQAYLDYLALYTTFHAAQRLALIIGETQRRGWRSKAKIIERDDVGRHPEFARNICEIGAFCAERSRLTRPLVAPFKKAADEFVGMLAGADVKTRRMS